MEVAGRARLSLSPRPCSLPLLLSFLYPLSGPVSGPEATWSHCKPPIEILLTKVQLLGLLEQSYSFRACAGGQNSKDCFQDLSLLCPWDLASLHLPLLRRQMDTALAQPR